MGWGAVVACLMRHYPQLGSGPEILDGLTLRQMTLYYAEARRAEQQALVGRLT